MIPHSSQALWSRTSGAFGGILGLAGLILGCLVADGIASAGSPGKFVEAPARSESGESGDWIQWDPFDLAEILPPPIHGETIMEGRYLQLILDPPELRPQDRWFALRLQTDMESVPGSEILIRVSDAITGEGGMISPPFPATTRSLARVDLRSFGCSMAQVEVLLQHDGKTLDRVVALVPCPGPEQPLQPGQTIPLTIDFPEENKDSSPWPVRFGLPFAPGQLWDSNRVSLQDRAGQSVPAQISITGRWAPQGSIKWLLVETQVLPGQELQAVIDAHSKESATPSSLRSQAVGGGYRIQTGEAEFLLAEKGSPVQSISKEGRVVATREGARGLFVMDQNGRLGTVRDALEWTLEESGPLALSLRSEGEYTTDQGERLARFILRLEFFEGQTPARFVHTLILTEDTNEVWFREVGWEFAVPGTMDGEAHFAAFDDAVSPSKQNVRPGLGFSLVQRSIQGLSGDEDRFELLQMGDGQEKVLQEGERMGDWAAIRSTTGEGFFVSVRDAALQAPKEFSIADEKLNVLLFSSRAGQELDFRAASLLERWDLASWKKVTPAQVRSIAEYESNAAGWAKTHEGLLAPIAAEETAATLETWSLRNSEGVYVHVDPGWIFASGALGPLYPQDEKNFPETEAYIRAVLDQFTGQVPGRFYTGFVDYFAGPHYGHAGRYRLAYTLFRDAWLNYARTGDRNLRRFAEGTSRAFRDNYIAHWDSGLKKRGLFVRCGSSSEAPLMADLPMYWEREATFNMTTSANLNTLLWDYQMAGDRRSAQVAGDMGRAFQTHWTPELPDWRIFMTLRMLLQLYEFTEDQSFRVMLEAGARAGAYDADSALLLTKSRPYNSSTYKTNTDVGNMIELYDGLGTARWGEMARRTSEFWFTRLLGESPRTRVSGEFLNFLSRQNPTADYLPQLMDYNLRLGVSDFDPSSSRPRTGVGFSTLDSVLQGFPYNLSVVAASGVRQKPLASILQFDDYGEPARIFFRKQTVEPFQLWINTPRPKDFSTILASQVEVTPWDQTNLMGLDVLKATQWSGRDGAIALDIPADLADGTYQITTTTPGNKFALASRPIPLVFSPGKYWRPATFNPPYRYYFKAGGKPDAWIFFEGKARLFGPQGTPFAEGSEVSGKVELTSKQVEMWSFELLENGLISSSGFPPYFAMNDPQAWFDPSEKLTEGTTGFSEMARDAQSDSTKSGPKSPLRGRPVGPGAGLGFPMVDTDASSQQAARASVPMEEGTVEFFFRPNWDTFSLRQGLNRIIKPMFSIKTDQPTNWEFVYRLDPEGSGVNLGPTEPSHSFQASIPMATGKGSLESASTLRPWRTKQILRAGEWVHVALVWGKRNTLGAREIVPVPFATIYVDGQGEGHQLLTTRTNEVPLGVPQELHFSKDLDGEIAWLRVSTEARYTSDFKPPMVEEGLAEDDATLKIAPLLQNDLESQLPQPSHP